MEAVCTSYCMFYVCTVTPSVERYLASTDVGLVHKGLGCNDPDLK